MQVFWWTIYLNGCTLLSEENGHVKAPSDIVAYVGAYKLTTAGKYSNIAAVYIHPTYDGSRVKNDIAILELVEPISPGAISPDAISTIAAAPTINRETLRVAVGNHRC